MVQYPNNKSVIKINGRLTALLFWSHGLCLCLFNGFSVFRSNSYPKFWTLHRLGSWVCVRNKKSPLFERHGGILYVVKGLLTNLLSKIIANSKVFIHEENNLFPFSLNHVMQSSLVSSRIVHEFPKIIMQHLSWPVGCLKEQKSFRTISENECFSQIFLSVAFLLMVYWILNTLIFGVSQITEARAARLSISLQLFLWIFFFKMIKLEKSPYVRNKHGQRHTTKLLPGQLIGIERLSQVFPVSCFFQVSGLLNPNYANIR